jgi:hypothetical protein
VGEETVLNLEDCASVSRWPQPLPEADPLPGWDTLENGQLLAAAEAAGFDLFLTTDKNIKYQQNLSQRKIAIVVLGRARWRLIRPRLADILSAVNTATPGSFTLVEIPSVP